MSPETGIAEPEQLPRFGPLRAAPPDEVVAGLGGAAAGTTWTAHRLGGEGGYPNGGIWRVGADRRRGEGPSAAVVKRTGAAYLGNIGTAGDQVVLIDWAYVGWAPIGHDAGHLALSLVEEGVDLADA